MLVLEKINNNKMILGTSLGTFILNKYLKNNDKLSLIFSLLCSFYGIYCKIIKNIDSTHNVIEFMLGYFIVDILNAKNIYIFHHCLSIYLLYIVRHYIKDEYKMLLNYVPFLEISSIFLSLKTMNIFKKNSRKDNINSILFALSFIIFRTFICSKTFYDLTFYLSDDLNYYMNILTKILCYCLIGLQQFWSFKIVNKIYRTIKKN
jgi:hypothetical protein